MKTIMSVIATGFLTVSALAQDRAQTGWYTMSPNNSVMVTASGSPAHLKKKLTVIGDPYFKPDFCEATFYASTGRVYRGVRSRLNLQTNTLSFKGGDKEEDEYVPAFAVNRIEFSDCGENETRAVFRSGFPATGLQNENTFYQVLDSGKTLLLKYVNVLESREAINGFNNTSTNTVLDRTATFYIYSPEKGMQKVSPKSADDLLKALSDKRRQLDEYLRANSVKVKKEDDLLKVVQYYNSL